MRWFKTLAILLPITLADAVGLHASTVEQKSFAQLVKDASIIVQASVMSGQRRTEMRQELPWTCQMFRVEMVVKGVAPEQLEVCFFGGQVGSDLVGLTDLDIPTEGARGVFFLYDLTREFPNPLVGWNQGVFYIDQNGGQEHITSSDGAPVAAIEAVGQDAATDLAPGIASGVVLAGKSERRMTTSQFIEAINKASVQP